jgi:hypothetical protein
MRICCVQHRWQQLLSKDYERDETPYRRHSLPKRKFVIVYCECAYFLNQIVNATVFKWLYYWSCPLKIEHICSLMLEFLYTVVYLPSRAAVTAESYKDSEISRRVCSLPYIRSSRLPKDGQLQYTQCICAKRNPIIVHVLPHSSQTLALSFSCSFTCSFSSSFLRLSFSFSALSYSLSSVVLFGARKPNEPAIIRAAVDVVFSGRLSGVCCLSREGCKDAYGLSNGIEVIGYFPEGLAGVGGGAEGSSFSSVDRPLVGVVSVSVSEEERSSSSHESATASFLGAFLGLVELVLMESLSKEADTSFADILAT